MTDFANTENDFITVKHSISTGINITYEMSEIPHFSCLTTTIIALIIHMWIYSEQHCNNEGTDQRLRTTLELHGSKEILSLHFI